MHTILSKLLPVALCSIKRNPHINGEKFTKFCANFCRCSIRKTPPKNGEKFQQILCKHKMFFTCVYMIFKYSKRFCFAPSFNKSMNLSQKKIIRMRILLNTSYMVSTHRTTHAMRAEADVVVAYVTLLVEYKTWRRA
jgi:hypothetical protein